jgi:hypothetical protein
MCIYLCADMGLYKIRGYPHYPSATSVGFEHYSLSPPRLHPDFYAYTPIPNPSIYIFMSPLDGSEVVGIVILEEHMPVFLEVWLY